LVAARDDGAFGPIFGALIPPLALQFVAIDLPWGLASQIWHVTLLGAVVGAVMVFRIRRLRPVGILVVALASTFSALAYGEPVSRAAMCDAAAREGLTNVTRHSLAWGATNTGREFQFEVHALAERSGAQFTWSYGRMRWFELPESIARNVTTGSLRCDA